MKKQFNRYSSLSSLILLFLAFECHSLEPTQEEHAAATRIQQYLRGNRVHRGIRLKYGFDPALASRQNLQRLRGELKALTPEERGIARLIVDNFTLSHSTSDQYLLMALRSDPRLKSPRQRKREGGEVASQHTSRASNTDDSVFFTSGIGKTASVKFIGSDVYTFRTLFRTFQEQHPDKAKYTFTAPHLSEFLSKRRNRRFNMYGVNVECQHHEGLTKTYRLSLGDNEQRLEHHFKDEVFTGEDIPWGLALQFIHLHRLCADMAGQTSKDSALATILGIEDLEKQIEALGALFTAFMPGEAHTEVQVPCTFPVTSCELTLPIDPEAIPTFPETPEEQTAQYIHLTRMFEQAVIDPAVVHDYLAVHSWLISKAQLPRTVEKCLEHALNPLQAVEIFLALPQLNMWDREYILDKAIELEIKRLSTIAEPDMSCLDQLLSIQLPLPGDINTYVVPKLDHTPSASVQRFGSMLTGVANLYQALFHGQRDLTKFLLNRGSRIFDDHMDIAIYISAYGNKTLALELARERGVQLDKSTLVDRAMVEYVEKGNEEAINLLRELRYPVDQVFSRYRKTYPGSTLLHVAAEKGHAGLARVLLDMGCDKDVRNIRGESAWDVIPPGEQYEELRGLLAPTAPHEPTDFEKAETKVFAAVAIVRRDDGHILMGRNHRSPGKPSRWRFPGGLLDEEDGSIELAAAREAEEETGLPLADMLRRGEVNARIRMVHQSHWNDKQGHETYFVEFTGITKEHSDIHPSDDFDAVVWLPRGQEGFASFPVVRSNWILMDEVAEEGDIRDALDIEYYGIADLRRAAFEGKLPRVKDLVAKGVPYDMQLFSPLQMAASGNSPEVVEYLYTLDGIDEAQHIGACAEALRHPEGDLFQTLLLRRVLPEQYYLTLYDASFKICSRPELRQMIADAIVEHGHVDSYVPGTIEMGMAGGQHTERPVLLTIKHKDLRGLRGFLAAGADLGFMNSDRVVQLSDRYVIQEHPLMAAIRVGFAEGVQELLTRDDIDPNCTSGFTQSHSFLVSSYFAPDLGHEDDIMSRLNYMKVLQKLTPTYLDDIPAIFMAVVEGQIEIVRALAEHPRIDLSRKWNRSTDRMLAMLPGRGEVEMNEEVGLREFLTEPWRFPFLSGGFFGGEASIPAEITEYLLPKLNDDNM